MSIADNLHEILRRLAEAAARSGRDAAKVRLLAVSKTVAAARMHEALAAGQLWFGENYVQEAEAKAEELQALHSAGSPAPEFHLIGPLQRNKAKRAVRLFEVIHTVDRASLAHELAKHAAALGKRQRVLLQVNISEEDSKSGVRPEESEALCKEILALPALRLDGLMCIGSPFADSEEAARDEFTRMRELRAQLEAGCSCALPELSMGMSGDFEAAIEEGATIVRVGSSIFGERPTPEGL